MFFSKPTFLLILLHQNIRRCIGPQSPTLRNFVSKRSWTKRINVSSKRQYTHIVRNTEDREKYRRLRLGVGDDLETGFQTLLFLIKNSEIAEHVRHLEVHGRRSMSQGLDFDFNNPPDDPRELELDDLERLKAAIKTAGFTEGNEPQLVLHMLLQSYGRDLYVNCSFLF